MLRTRFFEIADEHGMRYTRLAEKMGYSPEYLSRVKHGREPITAEFQRRACELFGDVAATDLFFEEGDDSGHQTITPIDAEKEQVPA